MQDKTYDIIIERTILSSLIFDFGHHQTSVKDINANIFYKTLRNG